MKATLALIVLVALIQEPSQPPLRATADVLQTSACVLDEDIGALKLKLRYRIRVTDGPPVIVSRGSPHVYYYRYAESPEALSGMSWSHIGRITGHETLRLGSRPDSRFVTIRDKHEYSVGGEASLFIDGSTAGKLLLVQLVVAPLDLEEDLRLDLTRRWARFGRLHLGGIRTDPFEVKIPGRDSWGRCR